MEDCRQDVPPAKRVAYLMRIMRRKRFEFIRVLTKTTTSATDHITRRAMLHKEGSANSSAPTPQRRPIKSKAGMARKLASNALPTNETNEGEPAGRRSKIWGVRDQEGG